MTDFDPYSEKIADICALIRQHGKCEAWELFKNAENGLEVLCAIVDAVRAEAKAAVPAWKSLTDEQWTNIVNHDRAYSGWDRTKAVHHAVRATEAKCKEVNAPAIAVAEQTKQQEPK